jgi:hypothetical protein
MKRLFLILAVGATVLALPASANAMSIHSFRVSDEGTFLAWGIGICTQRGYLVSFKLRLEDDYGVVDTDRYSRRQPYHCTRTSVRLPDVYESGTYYARLKVRVGETREVRYTRWKTFHVR